MKNNLQKLSILIKKNREIFLLIILSFISILSMQLYNSEKNQKKQNYSDLINNTYFQKTINHIFDNLKPRYKEIKHKITPGETFVEILDNYEISKKEIEKVKQILLKKTNLNNIKPSLSIEFIIDQTKKNKIVNFIYPISKIKKIQLTKNIEADSFNVLEIIANLNKKIIYKEGKITRSLYRSAIDQKIQPNIIVEFARIYGFQVDFQRDLQINDTFQIIYEIFEDDDGKIFETGNIIFADLNLRGQSNALYYFNDEKNEGHYDNGGKAAKKALMKTPINGARLSSKYGMRKHPIDGFNKMHRGTDFAAPKGTPIMASGDGVVIRAKWCGGGGNCVKIKHNSTYSTVYAHMSKFTVKSGQRVRQGHIIGYVGSTGKSTGPHLHYEVIKNGKKIDSQKLRLPSGKILKGKKRELFEIQKIKVDVLKSELILGLY